MKATWRPAAAQLLRSVLMVSSFWCALALVGCGDSSEEPVAVTHGQSGSSGATGGPARDRGTDGGKSHLDRSASRGVPGTTGGGSDDRRFKPEPPPRSLFSSLSSGTSVQRPTVVAIRSTGEMKRWIAKEEAGNPHGVPPIDVDFGGGRQAWAVFLPSTPSGLRFTVARVTYDGRTPRVYASLTVAGRGCKSPGAVTRPTAWAETRRLTGSPQLHVSTIAARCN